MPVLTRYWSANVFDRGFQTFRNAIEIGPKIKIVGVKIAIWSLGLRFLRSIFQPERERLKQYNETGIGMHAFLEMKKAR